MRVMFVCLGNICRSPLAHAVFQRLADDRVGAGGALPPLEVESSGTCSYHAGEQADARMRRTAARHGVRLDHLSRPLLKGDLRDYDLVVAMDDANVRDIRRIANGTPGVEEKLHLLRAFEPDGPSTEAVPDPYYGGPDGFEAVYAIVERCCRALLERIEDGELAAH